MSSAVATSDISYPWHLYPSFPFGGYNDLLDKYKLELFRLTNDIEVLSTSMKKETVFQFIIGAPMEECDITKTHYNWQYQQLMPFFLQNFAEKNPDIDVIIFVVSPNTNFDITHRDHHHPWFTKYFGKWHSDETHMYYSYKNIKVNIYCTMMPTIQDENNAIIDSVRSKFPKDDFPDGFDKFIQTSYDRDFVRMYYSKLDNLVNNILSLNGVAICFSFAVFRLDTRFSSYRNYFMFKEILDIFKTTKKNCFIAEWVFKESIYSLILKDHDKYLSYIKPFDDTTTYGFQFVIEKNHEGLTVDIVPSEEIYKTLLPFEINTKQISTNQIAKIIAKNTANIDECPLGKIYNYIVNKLYTPENEKLCINIREYCCDMISSNFSGIKFYEKIHNDEYVIKSIQATSTDKIKSSYLNKLSKDTSFFGGYIVFELMSELINCNFVITDHKYNKLVEFGNTTNEKTVDIVINEFGIPEISKIHSHT